MRDQRRIGASGVVERHGRRCDFLVAGAFAVSRAAMVADHAHHMLAVFLVSREWTELLGHFGRCRIADAGHDGGQRAADRTSGIRVIRDAAGHQQAADVRVTEAERAEFVGPLGNLLEGN